MRIIVYLLVFMGMAPGALAQMGLHYNEVQQRYPQDLKVPERQTNALTDYKRTGLKELRMIIYNEDSMVISLSILLEEPGLTEAGFKELLAREVPQFEPTKSLHKKDYFFELDDLHELLVMRYAFDASAPFPVRHVVISEKSWMKHWLANTEAASWLEE